MAAKKKKPTRRKQSRRAVILLHLREAMKDLNNELLNVHHHVNKLRFSSPTD
jgi:hypothetical protein